MRTFQQLLTMMRREVVTESTDSGGFDDADLLAMLYQASSEIAAMLSFPVAIDDSLSLDAGDRELPTLPTGMAWPRSLRIYGDELALVPRHVLERKYSAPGHLPRFFAWDPRRGGTIRVAPVPADPVPVGAIEMEYVQDIDAEALAPGDLAWGGQFPDFQFLIPFKAGVNAWESVGDAQAAQYFDQRFMNGLQAFAAKLGVTDVANLLVPNEARHDRGAR